MTRGEAVNWLINIMADIGKAEHRDLWHYEQALCEIRDMLEYVPDTNVGDMISRQAAIMCLIFSDGTRDLTCGQMAKILNAIKALPSAQPEQRWIPCSERLPEVGTYVLISKKALNFRSNLPSVCTAHRSCDQRSGKEEWNDMLFGKLDDDKVLAWQPLPEPYKEEER